MWPRIPIFCWPSVWLASWLLGAATATARRLPAPLAPQTRPAWRTPLLKLHVQTLRPSPRAGLARPAKWLRPPLQLVKPDCEGS